MRKYAKFKDAPFASKNKLPQDFNWSEINVRAAVLPLNRWWNFPSVGIFWILEMAPVIVVRVNDLCISPSSRDASAPRSRYPSTYLCASVGGV